MSAVCRQHDLAPSVFYRWRAVAQGGAAVTLRHDAQRALRKDNPEARLMAKMEWMRTVIVAITARNPEQQKRSEAGRLLPSIDRDEGGRNKAAVMQIVEQTKRCSGWQTYRTPTVLGVPRRVYYV